MKRTNILKMLAPIAIPIIGLLGVSAASAWGPEDRATFTMANPATYPVFNSITDNPNIGDERNFVRIGEINSDVTQMANEIEVVPGKQYLVRIYFHNNASSTFNDAAHNNSGVATQSRVSSSFSTLIKKGERGTITGTISAENTNPKSVWDEAYMTTNLDQVYVRYVEGSAKIYNGYATNGSTLSSNIFTKEGTYIGLNSLNGLILGCEEYSGVVSYVLQVDSLNASLDKYVSKDGSNFKENTELKAGEEVTFKLTIKNTGTKALTNATIKDTLPAGLSFVSGSATLSANNSGVETPLPDGLVTTGYNLGTVGNGNEINITYRAVVSADFKCKGANLVNSATLTYDTEETTGHSITDTSKVTVIKEDCEDERKKPGFEIDKKASIDGQNWYDDIKIKPGDTVTFGITYKNTGNVINHDVRIYDVLDSANGMELVVDSLEVTRSVEGSVETGGAIMRIELAEGQSIFNTDGLLIGDVRAGETISVSYKVRFTAEYEKCEITKLYNNAKVTGKADGSSEITTVHDSVEIQIDRTDENCDTPKPDCSLTPDAPECNFPVTGPVEIAMAIAIALGICGGGYYFYRTKKSLKTIEGTAAGKDTAAAANKPAEPKADKK